MTPHRLPFTILTLWLAVGPLPAQTRPVEPALAIIRTKPERVTAAQGHLQEKLARLSRPVDHEGRLLRAHTDSLGVTTTRFQQFYRGVKVWNGQWLAHQDKAGHFLADQSGFQPVGDVSVEPVLSAADAVAVAQKALNPKGGLAIAPTAELVLLPSTQQIFTPSSQGNGTLNARDLRHRITGHDLAYHVGLMVANPQDGVAQRDYMIHAITGKVVREWDSLESDTPAKGQGKSEYSGTVTLDTVQKPDQTFDLVDSTRPTKPNPVTGLVGNATYDMAQQWPDSDPNFPGTLFNDADDQWGDGSNFNPDSAVTDPNEQTAGVDAHFGLQATWDTYKNVFLRDGIDDQGTSTFSRVHYGDQYPNAFWNTGCFCMTYGDGYKGGWSSGPMNVFTELDVAGHEMSHGVMAFSAGMVYYDEMGGLNESNSDIMGKLVEFYALGAGATGSVIPDTGGQWKIGWALMPSGTPLRWMTKPSLDGASPDYWMPSLGQIDVHYSSGANNRMFYFLSNGASASAGAETASRFLPAGMTGIGNQKAGQIWYRALTTYLAPFSRYFDARRACVRAAADLYGELSPEYKAVQNAYGGINVGLPADGTAEDFTPPVVQSVAVQGTTGTVYFTTQATDDRGLATVDYYADGFYIGTAAAPDFRLPFDSATLSNGVHALMAVAWDTNQNGAELSAALPFTLHNAVFEGLQNGGFEWELESWTTPSNVPDAPYITGFSHSGTLSVLLGDVWDGGLNKYLPFKSALYQDVKLPSDCDTLSLGYWFFAAPPDPATPPPTDGLAHDLLSIRFLDAQGALLKDLGSYSNLDDTPDPFNPVWVHKTFDVSELKGQVVRLQVDGSNDDQGFGTAFLLDDFTLEGTSAVVPNPADLNGDGLVDGYDLALLMASYSPATSPRNPKADLNGDGVVDDKDLDLLLARFGK